MRLQICFSPSRYIDLPGKRWKSAADEIAFAASLGASYINLWVWQSVLFHGSGALAESFYRDCIAECRRRDLSVIGKLPNWDLPYGLSEYPGIPEIGSSLYNDQLNIHSEMAALLNRELQLDGWMMGNEPPIEGTKYGWHPSDPQAEYHTPEDCIQIAIDKTRAIAPELDGIRIGYVFEPIGYGYETEKHLKQYWDETSDLLDYASVNAYPKPQSIYRTPYEQLNEIAPLWPSEQGVAREWTQSHQHYWNWTESLIDDTQSWSDIFSYFMLTETSNPNWGLIRRDGSVDSVADLLRERFYQRRYFHSVG